MEEKHHAIKIFSQAERYFSQRNWAKATLSYKRVLQLTQPNDSWHLKALNNLAEICLQQERYQQAKQYLDQLLALRETAKGLANLAHYYLNGVRDIAKAEQAVSKSLAQEESLEALYIAGVIAKRQGQRVKAQGFFQKVLEQDPDHVLAREQLAALFSSRRKPSKPPS